ncbi:DedA family protein [Candidatus Gracilibacteria bacterium]|nr:DedA family protein [Candidatus Gracilibacteria bacterium]
MVNKLVIWTESFAKNKHRELYLFAVAFAESSFFLVPVDVLIIAILSHGLKVSWIRIASISTLGSVVGGIFGYFIGLLFYTQIGEPIVKLYGLENQIKIVGEQFNNHAFISILVAAFTPIPYKVFTIGAGLFSLNIFTFVSASIIGRGARFFLVAYFSDKYGVKAKDFIIRKADKVLWILGVVVLISVYFFTK